jgi:hypothetical protein
MRSTLIVLAAVLALSGGAAPALASGRDVINDCTDDEILTKTYTQQEYRDALAKLPADADQYGNCRDIIARAQDAAVAKAGSKGAGSKNGGAGGAGGAATSGGGTPGGTSGGGTSGGGTSGGQPAAGPSVQPTKDQLAAASAADRAAVQDAARNASRTSVGAGNPIGAQGVGTAPGSGVSDLPVPVLVLLGLLLAGMLALAAIRIRSLVHARGA